MDNFERDIPLLSLHDRGGGEKKPAVLTSHGELVEAYARMAAPGLKIARYPIRRNAQGALDMLPSLQAVFADIRAGKPIDAVNVSFALSVPIQRLREDLSLPGLNAGNIRDFRRYILARLGRLRVERIDNEAIRQRLGDSWRATLNNLRTQLYVLQEIGRKMPLYVSGGNDGPGYLNLLSLARNVITVGALRPDGRKAHYSSDNQLIRCWERVGYPLVAQTDGNRLAGFHLDAPGKAGRKPPPALPVKDLRIPDRTLRKHWGQLNPDAMALAAPFGTSLAAPQAAAKAALSGKRINFAGAGPRGRAAEAASRRAFSNLV